MVVYFKIAERYNIVDKPNERSSHKEVTLRGGGIIFWFSALLYFTQHASENYLFFIGITIVSLVSFWDDIQSLSNKVRILAHFLAISLIFWNVDLFSLLPWWAIAVSYIVAIGIINAYNFMDGINGITGLYTLIVMGSVLYVDCFIVSFMDKDFIIYGMLASIVFLFFNYRKKAKCFAGDVGSIAIAYWVIYLLVALMISTDSLIWILFLAIYGVDAICTILHRLYLRQNIFKPHRLHFYQIMSNEYKIDHRIVALGYAIVQMIISFVVIISYNKLDSYLIILVVLCPLILIYLLKFKLIALQKNESATN